MLKVNDMLGQNAFNELMNLSDEVLENRGHEFGRVLKIPMKNGRYSTTWGDKTAQGLYLTIAQLMIDTEQQFK